MESDEDDDMISALIPRADMPRLFLSARRRL